MVNVMFACFMLMFAVTALDIKKNVHRRLAREPQAIVSAAVMRPQQKAAGGRRLPKQHPEADVAGIKQVDPPLRPTSFWESAAGSHDGDGAVDIGPKTAIIEINPLRIDEESPTHP